MEVVAGAVEVVACGLPPEGGMAEGGWMGPTLRKSRSILMSTMTMMANDLNTPYLRTIKPGARLVPLHAACQAWGRWTVARRTALCATLQTAAGPSDDRQETHI